VLPRPLFIETVDGLAALAEEGVPLPARCERTFQRQNDNANISLRLYQEKDPIGEIRIEGIPSEGGRGSFVDLQVEVTEKNQIRGTASIRTRDGRVVCHKNVHVHFEMPEVPSADELRDRFEQLNMEYHQLLLTEPERAEEFAAAGQALLHEAERLFEQQPLERQEVEVCLRKLAVLLRPPEDDMNPPRRVFLEILGECRSALLDMAEKAREVLAQGKTDDADPAALAAAQKALPKAEHLSGLLERLEAEGLAAHARKDRKAWPRFFEGLLAVQVQVQERPRTEAPPTMISKFFASIEVMRQVGALQAQGDQLVAQGRLRDWKDELNRIQAGLQKVLDEINGIDDELPGEQGRAQIHRIFSRMLHPLKEDIEQLGQDVRQVK
jgi:hypothetical protein